MAAARLDEIERALDVGVDYFFYGFDSMRLGKTDLEQGALRMLIRYFLKVSDRNQQMAFCNLAQAMADPTLQADHALEQAPQASS